MAMNRIDFARRSCMAQIAPAFARGLSNPAIRTLKSFGSNLWGRLGGGWLLPPQQLRANGRPIRWESGRFNIILRLGALQADKLRALGDLQRSLADLACTGSATILLVSRGHIEQTHHLLAKKVGDWALFVADREAACKQLPTDPSDQKNAIVAQRRLAPDP